MKRLIVLFTIVMAFTLAGCSKKEKMVSFIPTATPAPESGVTADNKQDAAVDEKDTDNTAAQDAPANVGKTTVKYVKMTQYGASLNVRATPSTDGQKVSSLNHADKIEVVDIKDGWASFVMDGKLVYVKSDYLVDARPDDLQPPTPTVAPTATPTVTPTVTPKP